VQYVSAEFRVGSTVYLQAQDITVKVGETPVLVTRYGVNELADLVGEVSGQNAGLEYTIDRVAFDEVDWSNLQPGEYEIAIVDYSGFEQELQAKYGSGVTISDYVMFDSTGTLTVEEAGIGDGNFMDVENPDSVKLSLALEDYVHNNFFFTVNGCEGMFESIDPKTGVVEDIGLLVFYTRLENSADCTVDTADEIIEGGTYDYEMGMYKVRSNGIAAKDMGDDVWYKMYVKTENGYIYSRRYKFSPRLYALDTFNDPGKYSDDLRALCVALMNYGADAQVYFAEKNGYKYEQLMNVGFEKHQNLVKEFDSSVITERASWDVNDFNITVDPIFTNIEYYFSLESALVFNFKLYTNSNDLVGKSGVLVWTEDQYQPGKAMSVEDATAFPAHTVLNEQGIFDAGYPGLAAKEMDKTLFACAYLDTDEGRVYSTVVRRNVDHFANWIINNDENPKYRQLMKSMTLYGEYADEYFAKK